MCGHGTIAAVPAKSKPTKRDAILDTTLDVVVERGFHEAPMSLIAERSGASAGVIYHYFVSKQEIIQAVYARIRALKREHVFAGYSPEMPDKEAFIHLWMNAYRFHRKYQREMHFLDQYKMAGFLCQPDPLDEELAAFERRFATQASGGILMNWPREVLEELTFGMIERLAKHPRKLSPAVLHEIAEKMWHAVCA